jgi:hypothetical protein
MTRTSPCEVQQYSDQMVCTKCNLVWDAGDSNPPRCRQGTTFGEQWKKSHKPCRFWEWIKEKLRWKI